MGQTSLESMRNRLEEIQYITSNGLFFRTLFTQTAILFVIPLLDFFWYHTRYVHFFFKGKELYFIVFLGDGAMRRTLLTFTTSLRFKTSFCSLSGYRYLFFFFSVLCGALLSVESISPGVICGFRQQRHYTY